MDPTRKEWSLITRNQKSCFSHDWIQHVNSGIWSWEGKSCLLSQEWTQHINRGSDVYSHIGKKLYENVSLNSARVWALEWPLLGLLFNLFYIFFLGGSVREIIHREYIVFRGSNFPVVWPLVLFTLLKYECIRVLRNWMYVFPLITQPNTSMKHRTWH